MPRKNKKNLPRLRLILNRKRSRARVYTCWILRELYRCILTLSPLSQLYRTVLHHRKDVFPKLQTLYRSRSAFVRDVRLYSTGTLNSSSIGCPTCNTIPAINEKLSSSRNLSTGDRSYLRPAAIKDRTLVGGICRVFDVFDRRLSLNVRNNDRATRRTVCRHMSTLCYTRQMATPVSKSVLRCSILF